MSVYDVGNPDTLVSKALQRVYAAFMVPTDTTHLYEFDYPASDFVDDPEGNKLEDYIYRSLAQALKKMGKQVGGIGMPQLKIVTHNDPATVTIIWRIPSRIADIRLHSMLQGTVSSTIKELDWFEDYGTAQMDEDFLERTKRIRAALSRLTDEGLTFGMIQELNERADAIADADPPEVPQAGAQG